MAKANQEGREIVDEFPETLLSFLRLSISVAAADRGSVRKMTQGNFDSAEAFALELLSQAISEVQGNRNGGNPTYADILRIMDKVVGWHSVLQGRSDGEDSL